jgi:pimeloyl-ACP methyl ester carboxylesterase
MGAAVAALYAAAAPERARSLVMLDSLGPISESPEHCSSRLRKNLRSLRAGPRRRKAYASIDDMIKARQANSGLHDESARLICERSIAQREAHYEWSNDPALYWVSPVLLSEEQVLDYLRHIETGVLSLTATPHAPYVSEEQAKSRTAAIPHGRHLTVEGDHHFHMHMPGQIAATIREFILEQELHFASA